MSKEGGVNKATLNYWVDVLIAIAFVVSGISGLVFLIPVSLTSVTGVLGVSFLVWDKLHIWGSLAMMVSVGAHLLLHAKWIAAMTKRVFRVTGQPKRGASATPALGKPAVAVAGDVAPDRRRILIAGGATAAVGLLAAACGGVAWAATKLLELDGDDDAANDAVAGEDDAGEDIAEGFGEVFESERRDARAGGGKPRGRSREVEVESEDDGLEDDDFEDDDSGAEDDGEGMQVVPETPASTPTAAASTAPTVEPPSSPTPAPTATTESLRTCVTCPRHLVNDPYPGRCRLYVDANQNQICDRSEPVPCG